MVTIRPPTTNSPHSSSLPTDTDLDGTVGIPLECELSAERFDELVAGTISRTNHRATGKTLQPITNVETRETTAGDDELVSFTINLEHLWEMIYEHRRYSAARGFSDCEMRVLKAMRTMGQIRITAKEIKDNEYLDGYSEGAVHNALNNLQDKQLVDKPHRGLYRLLDR